MNRKKRVVVPRVKGTKQEAAAMIESLLAMVLHNGYSHDFVAAEKKCQKCKTIKQARTLIVKLRETTP
jgi:hypothetical protein